MNRRGFLAALLGAAAAPIVAQIADKFPGPEMPPPDKALWTWSQADGWTVIDLRARARRELGEWFARRVDEAIFAGLTGRAC